MFNLLPYNTQKALFWGFVLLPLSTCNAQTAATQSVPAPAATISVDATSRIGQVPPYLFGQNLEVGDLYQVFTKNHVYTSKTAGGAWDPKARKPVANVLQAVSSMGIKMFRYPGGCSTHNWEWKKTIGPLENRPNIDFGLDEYLEYCRISGTEPMITISDYSDTSSDAADLVEYLNMPATPQHPWAQKRAANGHVAPYGVKYFEMGNESDHGNHDMQPPKKFSAQDYANWFIEYALKMKAVDPTIHMGALMLTGGVPSDPWNDVVLITCKPYLDFIIIHKYGVGVNTANSQITSSTDLLMRACMANAEQFDVMLAGYREKILRLTGKPLPLALTEYNALFIQPADDQPLPYRYSLGAALFSADYLRVLMRPDSNVFNADYWQLMNGYWGLAQTQRDGNQKMQAAYYLFRLWGQHFGPNLVANTVSTPRIPFEGLAPRLNSAMGDKYQPETVGTANVFRNDTFKGVTGANYRTEVQDDGSFKATFSNLSGEAFAPISTLTGKTGQSYLVSFEARSTGDVQGSHLGLGVIDSRGWNATQSGIGIEGAETSREWKRFAGKFAALSDNKGTDLTWRLRAGATPISGSFEIRNLKIVNWELEKFPAYAAITSSSSLSADGKKLYVMVFNKHHADAINTTLNLKGFPARQARRWAVTGPSLSSTNMKEQNISEVESGVAVPVSAGKPLTYRAPAHSMTAWEFTQ